MRVLFWSASFWPHLGGLEAISSELVRRLQSDGIELVVMTPLRPGEAVQIEADWWEGVPIYRFPFCEPDLGDFLALTLVRHQVLKLKRKFQPDLIHVNGINSAIPMLLLCRESEEPPWLTTLHGDWENYRPPIMKQLLAHSSWITACSQHTLELLHHFEPTCIPKSSVVLNAMPEIAFETQPGRDLSLLCAGRLSPEKQFDVALRAVQRLPGVCLRIAGSGPQLAELMLLAESLGIASRVTFLGRLDRKLLQQEMRNAWAVLIPSRIEGFGLVALEAAQAGTPVIASRVGGLAEIVDHGQTGLLVDSFDEDEWAQTIARILHTPQLRSELGQAARLRCRQKFSWDQFRVEYLKLYQRLTAPSPSSLDRKDSADGERSTGAVRRAPL